MPNTLPQQPTPGQMTELGALAAGVTHEINNLVSIINSTVMAMESKLTQYVEGNEEVLGFMEEQLSAKAFSQAHELQEQHKITHNKERLFAQLERLKMLANRTEDIVAELRYLSQAKKASPSLVNINQELQDTLLLLKAHLPENLHITANFAEGLPPVPSYAGQLNQVFMNILRNAIDAMAGHKSHQGHKGTITVSTRKLNASQLEVCIADNGPGIPKAIGTKVFEPLFTTKGANGTGLGLYISYSIVQQHNGRLTFDSTPETGTTFRIQLPTAPQRSATN